MEQHITDFIETVRLMRKHQKRWYQFKFGKDLAKAKSLELQVDELLKQLPEEPIMQFSKKGLFKDDETRF